MSNIHSFSNLHRSSTSKPAKDSILGNISQSKYHTISAGAHLEREMSAQSSKPKKSAALGRVSNTAAIGKKLIGAITGGKETEIDKQLAALSRQKQRVDLPMTPEVREAAYTQREGIKPEKSLQCPNGHKIPAAAVKKQLTTKDIYTCPEKGDDGKECGAMCGGEDVHPLHLEIRYLSPADKNKYVDSVRWLSKSEVDIQTKEYIKGHPLVFPHLAVGVLFNDETDAWIGWTLGWNIYYWYGDIQKYWDRMRKELESKSGRGLDEDEDDESEDEESKPRGRGQRKKRKIVDAKVICDDDYEQLEEEDEVEVESKERGSKKSKSTDAAAATSFSSSSSTAATKDEPIELD